VIKVQFPDLHEQFKNTRALTIMASKIGEVLEIEAVDSYIKRPAGPMITIELRDISKLPGYIRIPSMAEGAEPSDIVAQRILYSSLLNQCRKCRRFGHHARACTINRSKPWEGAPVYPPTNIRGPKGKEPGGEEFLNQSKPRPANNFEPKMRGGIKRKPRRSNIRRKIASIRTTPLNQTSPIPP
jgi:hypothetical protein